MKPNENPSVNQAYLILGRIKLLFCFLFFPSAWLSGTDADNFKTQGQVQVTIFLWQQGTFLNGAIDHPGLMGAVTQEPSQSIKDPLGGKEHIPWASHFLWKYLTGNSLCAGYIRFSYCKHWDALPGLKVKASNVEGQTRGFRDRLPGQRCGWWTETGCFVSNAAPAE